MPFDPISLGIAGAGALFDFIKGRQAQNSANAGLAAQQQYLANALAEARYGKSQAMQTAGGLREDQFGNATYYDPAQGRWITSFSPTQQRIIDEGQQRQIRAQTRGRQASQDYDTERAGFLYDKPKTEAQSYAEIVQLMQDAMGTGERGLNTLMNRFGIRTAGNLPQITQMDTGPSPGQQLAETMLKARQAALEENIKRKASHSAEYLPAMKQFEDTANYVAPVDPTGSSIVSMAQQGIQDLLKTGTAYDQLLGNINIGGARNVGSAQSDLSKTIMGDKTGSDLMSLAKMMMPGADKTGAMASSTKVGGSGGGGSSSDIGDWDHRFNYLMTNDPSRGAGGEAAPFGRPQSGGGARFGVGSGYGAGAGSVTDLGFGGSTFPPVGAYGNPYGFGNAADYSEGYYKNPFGAWQF
jgi:hypothetical protein